MLKFIISKIIGSQNERQIKKIRIIVDKINSLEAQIQKLSDSELKAKTEVFKAHLAKEYEGAKEEIARWEEQIKASGSNTEKDRFRLKLKSRQNSLFDEILPEAFACVREVSLRITRMRHFDVQLIGGIVLHEGKISEMATGEGKTLVATLPAYLNALLGKGVHVITVNDYLARRDREWMGPIYEFLGLSVGVIQHDMPPDARRQAYGCDITYGTNNEFGFDYLRDNMVTSRDEMVQRPFYYAIVDEVDSILVDEARTPLIISGPAEESTEKYYQLDKIVPKLKGKIILEREEIDAKYKGVDLSQGYDYVIDEKAHTASLTEEGEVKACQILGIDNLHEIETMEYRHHLIQALRAHNLYKNEVDYVIKEGQVLIVDEFTGRLMPGRRWSDGLHQAVEAKEGLKIERENQTLATITFQNYFRMYAKLSGMTGTASTEASEFKDIYSLEVVSIPTNQPLSRTNFPDRIYKSEKEKFNAVVEEIVECSNQGRPVLVGTVSIRKSEVLAEMLKIRGVRHQVLNAKYHEMEASIISQAGRFKGVTIATNMAGRGTDILLGGNADFIVKSILKQKDLHPQDEAYKNEHDSLMGQYKKETEDEHNKVVKAGGLHVIGTERHESRRIDNQLRGRSGRQGDPGSSRFYVSLGDDLMRLFGSDKLVGLMSHLGLEEGQVIEHPWVSKSIEIAQKRVEQHNFEIRKQLLEYDNVMNKQREVIYDQRRMVLEGISLNEHILGMVREVLEAQANQYISGEAAPGSWDIAGFSNWLKMNFSLELEESFFEKSSEDIVEAVYAKITEQYSLKEKHIGADMMRHLERMVCLQIVDTKWKDNLYAMDSLREGIGLRAYGQRDPLIEYQREAYAMFGAMIESIKTDIVDIIFKVQAAPASPEGGHFKEIKGVFSSIRNQEFAHPEAEKFPAKSAIPSALSAPPKVQALEHSAIGQPAVERNDPCPCGSGKKYKKCCGK